MSTVLSKPSGLSAEHLHTAHKRIEHTLSLALDLSGEMNYTQGPGRWSGITDHRRAYKGQVPIDSDCSAFATWVWWDATLRWHPKDFINGQAWKAGYTGTMVARGLIVPKPTLPGDLVIYGTGVNNTQHVAVGVGDGKHVVGHGSPGAHFSEWDYRPVVRVVRPR
jgi:cell wall-associated NlpC family hydrolase